LCEATIKNMLLEYITTPKEEDWLGIVITDDWDFPNSFCAPDIRHIVTEAPANTVPLFCNYLKALIKCELQIYIIGHRIRNGGIFAK
jgi:hypothetical protein